MNLATVCACAPSLKPLVGRIVPAFSSRDIAITTTSRSGTRRSRLSSVGRSFQKLSDKATGGSGSSRINKSGSSARTSELNGQGGEMEMGCIVPPLPTQVRGVEVEVEALPSPKIINTEHIVITNVVDQRYDRRTSDASSRRFLQGQLGAI
jgi:hypothetical protein